MAIKLPRLPLGFDKMPDRDSLLQRYWQSLVETTEGALNNIRQILVDLGVVTITADGALALAQSAIKPGGEIKDAKVATSSVAEQGVTAGAYSQLASNVALPDATETSVISLSFTKALDESEVDVSATIRIASSNDIIGTFSLYCDGVLTDTAEYNCQTNGGVFKAILPYGFIDDDAAAGPRSYDLRFTRDGGGSAVEAIAGTLLRCREFKR